MEVNTGNYINYHVLISHSPSCLNRDDMNMQKTAAFGGVRRVRISSQSLKRALRTSEMYASTMGQMSIRTRELAKLREKLSDELGDSVKPEIINKAVAMWVGKQSDQADAVAPWCVAEIKALASFLKEAKLDEKQVEKKIKEHAAALARTLEASVDIALFGRMATSGLMLPIDGSLAVAHSITTHKVESDIDWFTAVDDLIQDEGDSGAGHLDTQEFSSGVFYRYASLNIRQLQHNLGGEKRERVLELAAKLFLLMTTVVPQAKQQPFAAFNRSDYAIVTFGDQPLSLANAFEEPIKRDGAGGFLKPSVIALSGYWAKMRKAYSLNDAAAAFDFHGWGDTEALNVKLNAASIQDWIRNGGR